MPNHTSSFADVSYSHPLHNLRIALTSYKTKCQISPKNCPKELQGNYKICYASTFKLHVMQRVQWMIIVTAAADSHCIVHASKMPKFQLPNKKHSRFLWKTGGGKDYVNITSRATTMLLIHMVIASQFSCSSIRHNIYESMWFLMIAV